MNHERVNASLQICTATSTLCRHLVSLLLFQPLGENVERRVCTVA